MAAPVSVWLGVIRSLPAKLEQLLSPEDDHRLHKRDKNKIRLLKDHLQELIDTYLMEPSEVEAPTSSAARCWLKEVRELSYDIDDFHDELVHGLNNATAASHKNLRAKIAKVREDRSRSRWVADETTRFKSRLEEAIQRHKRYNLDKLRSDTSRIDSDESPILPLYGMTASRLVGIRSSMEKLQEWLSDGEQGLRVVSIVGSGGIGKTTLAKELYSKLRRQFECQAFARSSQKPDMRRLLTSILLQVRRHQLPNDLEMGNLTETIRTYLQNKKYFIIIDDLWDSSTWDIVYRALPDDKCCSRVLTMTEIDIVAQRCCGHSSKHIFYMEPLSEKDSSDLFFSRFIRNESGNTEEFDKVSSEIVRKCGGFPLATIAAASILARQKEQIEHCIYISKSLSSNLRTNATIEGMKQVLSLCYTSLPDRLQACILYLSIYKEGHIIWKDALVKQWIAEGFICAEQGKHMDEVAGTYFDDLVNGGMIQPVDINYNGEVITCTVHYIVLNLIKYRCIEDNFVTAIDYSQTNTRLADKVRRLSLHFGDVDDAESPSKLRLSQVRSLVFFGLLKSLPPMVEFRLLRVLILHLWGDQDNVSLDLTTVCKFFRLRNLDISCNVTLNLQIQLHGLEYLETLKIDSRVSEVPHDIILLRSLLHLSLPGDINLPNGIGRMTSLRTLGCFDLSRNSAENVQSLGELNNVRDLHLTCSTAIPCCANLEENVGYLGSVLSKLSNLRSLNLSPRVSSNTNTLEASASSNSISFDVLNSVSSPPDLLEKLEFSPRICIFSKLPLWTGELRKLSIIKIAVSVLWQSDIDILSRLGALSTLSLYVRTAPAERIVFHKEGFRVLNHFKFICSAVCVAFKEEAMPNLRRIKLGFNANPLEQCSLVDAGLENLTSLEVFSANVGNACSDESVRNTVHSALEEAFSECENRPIINIQLMKRTFYGDNQGWNQPAGSPESVVLNTGVTPWMNTEEQYLTTDFQETQRCQLAPVNKPSSGPGDKEISTWSYSSSSVTSNISQAVSSIIRLVFSKVVEVCSVMEKDKERHGKLLRGLQSIKKEMELVIALMKDKDKEYRGAVQEIWIQQLQEFAYDVEDFVETLWDPAASGKLLVAILMDPRTEQLRSIEHFKETISSLAQDLKQSAESSRGQDTDQGATSHPDEDAEEQLQSIDGPRSKIVELLKPSPGEGQQLRVISIVGCRGVGKTALARAVHKMYSSSDEFDCVAWVVASGCNKKKALLHRILESVREDLARRAPDTGNAPKEAEAASTTKPNLQEILSHKRCLVIVDDVQQAEVWKNTVDACPKNGSKSRIVATTSVHSVATACSSGSYVYRMQCLSDADSKSLFWRKVYGCQRDPPYSLVNDSESIFSKCGGLPGALISVAKHLNIKGEKLDSTHCIEVGQNLGKDYLSGTNNSVDVFKEMRRALMHSYDSLPDYDHRSCMLYLGIFPKGHQIKRKNLMRKLVAEGLVANEDCKCFDELIDRCIVEPVQIWNNSLGAKGCQVHGIVLEYIVQKSVAKNVVTLIRGHEPVLKGSIEARVRRLSIQSSSKERFDELDEDMSALRSLTMFKTEPPDLKTCKMLRILDLEGCRGLDQEGFLEGLSELLLLKYLNLRSTRINKLPTKIKKLQRLETLDIRDTDVKILPLDVIMLPKLAYLFGKFQLPEVPTKGKEAEKLYDFLKSTSSLHTLAGFVTNKRQSPEHVILLARNLKKVKVWCNDTPADHTELASSSAAASDRPSTRSQDHDCWNKTEKRLNNMDYIKLLKMRVTPLESVSINSSPICNEFLCSLEGPCTISSIKLRGILNCLPDSNKLRELSRIKKLQLFSTGLTVEDLSALQNLRGLEYLKLVEHTDRFCDGVFVVEKNGFESLKSLCIDAPKVPEMQFKEGSMRSLTSLYLLCPNSQRPSGVIDGISHLAKLSEVILHSSMQRAWEAVAMGHPNRPCVKRQPESTANTQQNM